MAGQWGLTCLTWQHMYTVYHIFWIKRAVIFSTQFISTYVHFVVCYDGVSIWPLGIYNTILTLDLAEFWRYIYLFIFILSPDVYIMKWKQFPHYWPFVTEIHLWSVDYPHTGPVMQNLDVPFVLAHISCSTNNWVASDLRSHGMVLILHHCIGVQISENPL